MNKYCSVYHTSIGEMTVCADDNAITYIKYGDQSNGMAQRSELTNKAFHQIQEYLNKERKVFDLPLRLNGTDFQKGVWNALCDIPYGKTVSYKYIAEKVGSPKACRAVGLANNKNPISIIVPCHRVVGANGKLVGYAGGIDIKEKLLEIEKE